ncbi:MAG: class I SAM-dependent methyltransferase [Planctomycetota bacterium]|jgi:ubiquinone/menaquinone biosynthesis C-methylase UbiE
MDENLRKQQEHYDYGWRLGLKAGREQLGNLQTNLEFIEQTGLLGPETRILEVGCGIGSLVVELSKKGYNITGTDISREAIKYGLEKYGDIRLMVQPAEELDFEDSVFDAVLSFDLFEHVKTIDRHISEVRRVLRPGGYYLFQTPNKYSNIIYETLRSKSLQWRRYHPSLHSPGQLKRRMVRHGFETKFVKMNPINKFTEEKLEKLRLLGHILRRVDFRRVPLVLQTNLYVIANKTAQ